MMPKEDIVKNWEIYFNKFFKEFENMDEVNLIKKKSWDFEGEIEKLKLQAEESQVKIDSLNK